MSKQVRIITYWILITVGFLAHSQTEMMPLLWGKSIVVGESPESITGMVAFMMFIIYTIPSVAILLLSCCKSKCCRMINAVLACIIALFCILHMGEWFESFNPAQLTIMPLMAVVGILLAVDSVGYAKGKSDNHQCCCNHDDEEGAEADKACRKK